MLVSAVSSKKVKCILEAPCTGFRAFLSLFFFVAILLLPGSVGAGDFLVMPNAEIQVNLGLAALNNEISDLAGIRFQMRYRFLVGGAEAFGQNIIVSGANENHCDGFEHHQRGWTIWTGAALDRWRIMGRFSSIVEYWDARQNNCYSSGKAMPASPKDLPFSAKVAKSAYPYYVYYEKTRHLGLKTEVLYSRGLRLGLLFDINRQIRLSHVWERRFIHVLGDIALSKIEHGVFEAPLRFMGTVSLRFSPLGKELLHSRFHLQTSIGVYWMSFPDNNHWRYEPKLVPLVNLYLSAHF